MSADPLSRQPWKHHGSKRARNPATLGRVTVVHCIEAGTALVCEGSSIRAVTRITGASTNTVFMLMIDAGKACAAYHDAVVRNLATKRVQVDEVWCFTYAKEKNVATAKAAPDWAGDTWIWTALEADSKLIIAWLVGGRDSGYAMALHGRRADRPF